MKKIEEEYQEYVVSEEIQKRIDSPLVLILNIDDFFKQVRRDEKFISRAIKRNRFVGKVFPKTKCVVDAQEEVLLEMFGLAEENLDYYDNILVEISHDNYQELLKLMDFLITHYMGNRSYYESRLEAIQQSLKGIEFSDYSKRNTREDIQKFFEQKINEIKEKKQLEKKRKI